MHRSSSIFLWILVGAAASGLSVGYFLHKANADRSRLYVQIRSAEAAAASAKSEAEQVVRDANVKVAAAATEVSSAQKQLAEYEQERALLTQAASLPKPDALSLKTWGTGFSVPLAASIRVPPGHHPIYTDSFLALSAGDSSSTDQQWLHVERYDAAQERALIGSLQNPVSVTYALNGRLLIGQRGALADASGVGYVLRTSFDPTTTSTMLLWARSGIEVTDRRLLETLSTLHFGS